MFFNFCRLPSVRLNVLKEDKPRYPPPAPSHRTPTVILCSHHFPASWLHTGGGHQTQASVSMRTVGTVLWVFSVHLTSAQKQESSTRANMSLTSRAGDPGALPGHSASSAA